jgi:hypothetical protein
LWLYGFVKWCCGFGVVGGPGTSDEGGEFEENWPACAVPGRDTYCGGGELIFGIDCLWACACCAA